MPRKRFIKRSFQAAAVLFALATSMFTAVQWLAIGLFGFLIGAICVTVVLIGNPRELLWLPSWQRSQVEFEIVGLAVLVLVMFGWAAWFIYPLVGSSWLLAACMAWLLLGFFATATQLLAERFVPGFAELFYEVRGY